MCLYLLFVEHSVGDGDEVPLFTIDHQEMRRQPEAESAGQPQHPHQKVSYVYSLYTVTSFIRTHPHSAHSLESTLPLVYGHRNIQQARPKMCHASLFYDHFFYVSQVVNMRNPLHAGNKACKREIHPGFGTQGWRQQKSKT